MKDNCFFDTNIIIYGYTSTEPAKGNKVRALIKGNPFISLQVIHEFANVLKKKFGKSSDEILKAIEELHSNFSIHQNTIETAKNQRS